jgi:serine/threonine protein kinase
MMTNVLDNLDIIKQIGKGSFSNVYLCGMNDIFDEKFIIKEICINKLVSKYISNNSYGNNRIVKQLEKVSKRQKENISDVKPKITPYENNHLQKIVDNDNEENYYYNRLKELIDSEVEVLNMLDNNNVIKFYGSLYQDDIYYLRMEYCNKGDVYDMLKRGELKMDRIIIEFIKQTICGLCYIHNQNFIHRDIKLHNILVKEYNGELCFKISDFGFACYDLNEKKSQKKILCKKYFKLCGTPYYMAPELILNMKSLENFTQFQEENNTKIKKSYLFYDKKVDMWSYGICLYELLFNALPFPNVKSVKELDCFYKGELVGDPQKYIDDLYMKKRLDTRFKKLLSMLLQINPKYRASSDDVMKYTNETFLQNKDFNLKISQIEMPIENMKLKEHVVYNPINKEMLVSDSWIKINNSISLVMKLSVQKGFLDWLLNK